MSRRVKKSNRHMGSSLDDFLKEEGIFEEAQALAVQEVVAGRDRSKKAEGSGAVKGEKLEVVRGSGNIFRDLGHKNADAERLKAVLAAEIIKALDRDGLSVRAAHGRTGIAAADFSRIRNADLGRFTVDRLMSIINRLGSRIELKIRVRRAEAFPHEATA